MCYLILGEKLPFAAECVKGAHNRSAVQQRQSAERDSRGSSLRVNFHKCSAKSPEPQLKTASVAARTQASRCSVSAARMTRKNDSGETISPRSPASPQSLIKNGQCDRNPSHNMKTASISTSTRAKQSRRTAVESRGSCNHDIGDNTDSRNKKHGSHSDRDKMNRSVSPAVCRNDKTESARGRLNKSPVHTAKCQPHCLYQVCSCTHSQVSASLSAPGL